ncbi:hypothetical protein [Thermus sp.]|jgi:hypothetical protein|uniref:hypothetical protein n=1 Tax=Thermus sp. TaxID=275 RepID=UPI0028CFAE70|nr:hypothetical protein [Thermus sp.]MDT7910006.1 hypothetical protein [Thermus sp.]
MWKLIANDPLMQFGLIVAGFAALVGMVGYWLAHKWGLLGDQSPPKPPKGRMGEEVGEPPRVRLEATPSRTVEAPEEHRRPRARLEVGPSGSTLYLPDGRRVALRHRDYRALGEAGQYLLPGTVLLVQGLPGDEAVRTSAHLLEVMGLQVALEASGDS